jgi:hypothetical protein
MVDPCALRDRMESLPWPFRFEQNFFEYQWASTIMLNLEEQTSEF